MSRARPSHRPNCACPRCRGFAHSMIYLVAFAVGCGLSAAWPPEITLPCFTVPVEARP